MVATHVISTIDKTNKDVVGEWRGFCKSKGLDNTGWKIFEVTGAKAGQELALDLLSFVGKVGSRRFWHGKERVHVLKADGL